LEALPIDNNLEHIFRRQLEAVPLPEVQATQVVDNVDSIDGNTSVVQEETMGIVIITCSLLTLEEHIENQMDEVHAGVPIVIFEQRTEDEQIEAMMRDFIAEEDAGEHTHEGDNAQPTDEGVTNTAV
jgi:hypothetical protein